MHVGAARDEQLGERVAEQLACGRDRDRADAGDLAQLARAGVATAQRRQVDAEMGQELRSVGLGHRGAGDERHEGVGEIGL